MEPIRSFIAIELPDKVKDVLAQIENDLKRRDITSVKWVNPDSIHLTIKFLGNVSTDIIPDITQVIHDASRGINPFRLQLNEPGVFPNLRAPRIVWMGITGEIYLLSGMQKNIDNALVKLGFTPEKRAFSPHLTLGRVRERSSPNEQRQLGETVAALKVNAKPIFTVDSISLMKSTLTREGAIYDCLASVDLQSG